MGKHENHGKSHGHENHSPAKKHEPSSSSGSSHHHHHHHHHTSHRPHHEADRAHPSRRRRGSGRPETPLERLIGRLFFGFVATILAGAFLGMLGSEGIGWSDMAAFVAVGVTLVLGVGLLVFFMRRADRAKELADARDDWVRAGQGAQPMGQPASAALAPAAPPPELVTILFALPSDRRAQLEASLDAATDARARIDALRRAIAERNVQEEGRDEALVSIEIDKPGEAPSAAALVTRALDALASRDAPTHEGGFRQGATLRSVAGPGHAVLALAILAREILPPARTLHDRVSLDEALDTLLSGDPDDTLHHGYRFVPEDAGRAFDYVELRDTFRELRGV